VIFLLLAAVMEVTPGFVIALVLSCLIGVPFLTLTFFVSRRLHELHTQHNKIDGELFISDSGECFAEYGIPIPEIINRNYILLKVHHIGGKEK
jgi:hypothetical protein